jgi:hypothetical protein
MGKGGKSKEQNARVVDNSGGKRAGSQSAAVPAQVSTSYARQEGVAAHGHGGRKEGREIRSQG